MKENIGLITVKKWNIRKWKLESCLNVTLFHIDKRSKHLEHCYDIEVG